MAYPRILFAKLCGILYSERKRGEEVKEKSLLCLMLAAVALGGCENLREDETVIPGIPQEETETLDAEAPVPSESMVPETVEPESWISVVNPQVELRINVLGSGEDPEELLALTGFHFEPWDGDGRYGMHSQTLERMDARGFQGDEYTHYNGKVPAGGR